MLSDIAAIKSIYDLLQKTWTATSEFVRNHWHAIMLVLVLLLGATSYWLLKKNGQDYSVKIQQLQTAHDEEVKKILDAQAVERKQHEENLKKLEDQLTAIQKEYIAAQQILETKKQVEIKEIVKDYGDNPDELAKKLSLVTGFQVIR
jgi:cell division protein FtsB